MKNSFVLLDGGDEENKKLRVAKVLLLFLMQVKGWEDGREFVFVQYMDFSPRRDNMDRLLGCVSVPWSTDDGSDPTLRTIGFGSGEKPLRAGE